MDSFKYTDGAPRGYECSSCGAFGCRLWRQWNTFVEHIKLLCLSCTEADQKTVATKRRYKTSTSRDDVAQIGNLCLAVPTEDGESYWGYTSIPDDGIDWWYALPLGPVRTEPPAHWVGYRARHDGRPVLLLIDGTESGADLIPICTDTATAEYVWKNYTLDHEPGARIMERWLNTRTPSVIDRGLSRLAAQPIHDHTQMPCDICAAKVRELQGESK